MIAKKRGLFSAWRFATLVIVVLFICNAASAQETREEKIRQEKAKKATELHPPVIGTAEKWVTKIQNWGVISGASRGFYPIIFGSAFPSGGSAFGAGYRHLVGDTGAFDIHGSITFTNTQLLETSLQLPHMVQDRLKSNIRLKYQDAPEVAFFGIGNNSDQDDETNHHFTPKSVRVWEHFDFSNYIGGGVEFSYEMYESQSGESSRVPSIEEIFPPSQVPGFFQETEYFVTSVYGFFDWRPNPGYAQRGGYYRVDWSKYDQRDGDGFNFERVDVELVQHVPILRGNQILSFRGLASFTETDDGQIIPFYLQPELGGGRELRGYPDFRFIDRHRMLLTAEYRWTPSKFMDMAIFYEVGKVAAEKEDLDFEDLHDSYGIGVRFHTPALTVLRIELALSEENTRIIFSGGPSF